MVLFFLQVAGEAEMTLGQLYEPRGLAREQAQAVLEIEEPYAVNVAWGCSNDCGYCYGPGVGRQSREEWRIVRHPKEDPVELVRKQLAKGVAPHGVFISFMTDPFLEENRQATEPLIGLLLEHGIRVATSSKVGVSMYCGIRHGMTVISLDEDFYKKWEPNALPPKQRIKKLKACHDRGTFTWISMEPCPPPQIWEQDVGELLEAIRFVNLIIKGRWQYNPIARSEDARKAYARIMAEVDDFCKNNGIRCHIKSETMEFIGWEREKI